MKYLMLLPFLLLCLVSSAQERGERNNPEAKKKIEALRVAFITEQLELTPTESEKFWPLHRQYLADVKRLKGSHKKGPSVNKEMSDKEIEAHLNQKFDREQKELDLKRAYYTQLKSVLPMWKIASLQKAERDFRKMILSKMKGLGNEGGGRG